MSKVMIVEDNDIMRYTIKDMLEALGHEVIADVGDARSALKYSNELKPEIILLDLILPDMTGIEIMEKLKQNNNLTKIIVTTALNQNKIDETIFAKGCDAILRKPFLLEDLKDILNKILKTDGPGTTEKPAV